ncbi:MAG: ketosteroid isomerase [Phycisphaerales bacterium]|nr:ketosteroid isomerase [Phycisphaerales bacterium]
MASTFEVGKKLVELCAANKNVEAVETLYADDIVSVEAVDMGGKGRTTTGKAAVVEKNKWWLENHEFHGGATLGPWPHDDKFIVHFKIDVTAKAGPMKGQRMNMEEAGLYTVKDGKIVREEFFYHMGG